MQPLRDRFQSRPVFCACSKDSSRLISIGDWLATSRKPFRDLCNRSAISVFSSREPVANRLQSRCKHALRRIPGLFDIPPDSWKPMPSKQLTSTQVFSRLTAQYERRQLAAHQFPQDQGERDLTQFKRRLSFITHIYTHVLQECISLFFFLFQNQSMPIYERHYSKFDIWERRGLVVNASTPDPEVGGSSPTRVKPCCVLEQGTFTPQKYW